MSESSQLRADKQEAGALLLGALQFAVLERSAGGEFVLIGAAPEWFRRLVPESAAGVALDLADRFPVLEVFLPEAEQVWSAADPNRMASDLWTETAAGGGEVHLRAWALNSEGRPFLVIELADALFKERQLVLQYAHETALQHETISRLNREVERANRAKSEFLAMMSHEIRTPLNAILGMADLLGESQLTPEQRKYVEIFQRAGSTLLNLINDILDLSKVEAGQLTLENIDFDLEEVVARAVELVRVKAREKNLEVGYRIAPGVPLRLAGDPTRLRQILLNLLGNSMKFTEKGGLTLRVERDPENAAPGGLRFAVADTGIGIAADKLNSVFASFTQADSSTTRKYGGTGLGLSISKRFVELMNGRIWVESKLGVGSTFYFTAQFGLSSAPPPEVRERAAEAAPSPPQELAPLRILLADDSEDNRFLIRAYLRDFPCSLEVAEDGESAYRKLTSGDYDLAIMDAHMPVMDGYTATARLREWERGRGAEPLPILALTADAFQEAAEKSRQAGFTAHLTKPIGKGTLLEAIHTHARRGATREPREQVVVDAALAGIVPRFLDSMRSNGPALSEALQRCDFDSIRTIGHNMKGTGTGYGFTTLTDIGAALEQAAKQHDAEMIRSKTEELAEYLRRIQVDYQ
jgi:signal transduction histidine kinase/CheY-like chemotaxis protein/HPt (histidine-containing phosphotransfer) domain-containing protein